MKKILTFISTVTFCIASLSAQQSIESIQVHKSNSDTIVIILKENQALARRIERLVKKTEKQPYMINPGYKRGYRADIELSSALIHQSGITSSHGFSYGNGLYIGGGAGFGAEFVPDFNAVPTYTIPVFADIKYSFLKTMTSPFVSLKAGGVVDITNTGIRAFANPSIGVDIARFSIKAGYEYQLGVWKHLNGKHIHKVKIGVAYTF